MCSFYRNVTPKYIMYEKSQLETIRWINDIESFRAWRFRFRNVQPFKMFMMRIREQLRKIKVTI